MKKKIVLASSSPRRKKILEDMGLEFEIIPSDYEEILDSSDFTYEKIEELAYFKAKAVADKLKNSALIISADTVVVLNEQILGKPQDEEDAMNMLKALSGNKHFVVTSICIIDTENFDKKLLSTTSYVEFEDLTQEIIESYVLNYKPLDKAGAYGIQELPMGFVKSVEGSFENIIGLCSQSVRNTLNYFEERL